MSGTSVPSWEVIPITKTLQNANEKVIVETDMTSSTGKAMSNITKTMNQSNENSKYDWLLGAGTSTTTTDNKPKVTTGPPRF